MTIPFKGSNWRQCYWPIIKTPRPTNAYVAAVFLASATSLLSLTVGASAQAESASSLAEILTVSLPASVARQRLHQPNQPTSNRKFDKILNGRDAQKREFPWQVALILSGSSKRNPFDGFYCGGTLVAWNWVLTAAHCTYENPKSRNSPLVEMPPSAIHVYLGSHDFSDGERIAVKRVVRKSYDEKTRDNDIALLELASKPNSKQRSARVHLLSANDVEPTAPGKFATAIGWGATATRRSSKILQVVDVQAKSSESCNRFYVDRLRTRAKAFFKSLNRTDAEVEDVVNARFPHAMTMITSHMMCAGTDIQAADTCFGDSGGPLLVKRGGDYAQAGIVSWGPSEGCGLANLYGVYTLTRDYIGWIEEQTK